MASLSSAPRCSELVLLPPSSASSSSSSSSSSFWGGEELQQQLRLRYSGVPCSRQQQQLAPPCRAQPRMMGNINEGKGVFAPLVVVVRNVIGKKRFNQLRGKAIALHSQVITEFCQSIGADAKQRQGLIRLAKKNGEKLGFLA